MCGLRSPFRVRSSSTRGPSFGEIYGSITMSIALLRPARDNAAKSLSVGVANGEYSRKG